MIKDFFEVIRLGAIDALKGIAILVLFIAAIIGFVIGLKFSPVIAISTFFLCLFLLFAYMCGKDNKRYSKR